MNKNLLSLLFQRNYLNMASEENFFNLSGINHLGEDFPDVSARRNYYNSSVEESIEEEVDITAEAEVSSVHEEVDFL